MRKIISLGVFSYPLLLCNLICFPLVLMSLIFSLNCVLDCCPDQLRFLTTDVFFFLSLPEKVIGVKVLLFFLLIKTAKLMRLEVTFSQIYQQVTVSVIEEGFFRFVMKDFLNLKADMENRMCFHQPVYMRNVFVCILDSRVVA